MTRTVTASEGLTMVWRRMMIKKTMTKSMNKGGGCNQIVAFN